MTTPTAVARAVARDAEQRARAALDDVLVAHTALRAADTALATAVQAQATAGPALARALSAARDAGITTEHLADLGITAPTSRTLRRRRPRTRNDTNERTPPDTDQRTPDEPGDGHPVLTVVATPAHAEADTSADPAWPHPAADPGHESIPDPDHHGHAAAATSW
jgi:hypothetical protein